MRRTPLHWTLRTHCCGAKRAGHSNEDSSWMVCGNSHGRNHGVRLGVFNMNDGLALLSFHSSAYLSCSIYRLYDVIRSNNVNELTIWLTESVAHHPLRFFQIAARRTEKQRMARAPKGHPGGWTSVKMRINWPIQPAKHMQTWGFR